jgi:glucose/arabinose dehydrogenase
MNRRRYLALAGTGIAGTPGCFRLGSEPQATAATETVDGTAVAAETVVTGLEVPWGAAVHEGERYLTERSGRVVRVVDGGVETVADLSDRIATGGEGGLLGLAFHPAESAAFTYQTYRESGSRHNRVVRHDLDGWEGSPVLDGIPGARIHDGGRLLIHDGALYVTAGDASNAESAQDRDALSGKVHRLTLDGDPHPDNPFGTTVFTWGHRNPQGLAPAGARLYATEHGPDTDDEVNLLEAGNNYGWPEVRGTDGGDEFSPALASFTPTIAPGGATIYPGDGPVDAWRGDLLFGTLAGSHLHRTRLEDGEVVGQERHFEDEFGRLRTTFVGPDGHLNAVTSNRDGRGSPQEGDDRVLRFAPT